MECPVTWPTKRSGESRVISGAYPIFHGDPLVAEAARRRAQAIERQVGAERLHRHGFDVLPVRLSSTREKASTATGRRSPTRARWKPN
jgi:hypothetical protein